MPQVLRTTQAEFDLIDLWDYVARDSPDAADRLLAKIDAQCKTVDPCPVSSDW